MPLLEQPVKCESCASELLIYPFSLGRINNLVNVTAGPGQQPNALGAQFAAYMCIGCGSLWPYRRGYGGSPSLQQEYKKIWEACKILNDRQSSLPGLVSKLQSMLDAKAVMQSLPGAQGIEAIVSAAVAPMRAEIVNLKDELNRRKGGRPPLTEEEKARREDLKKRRNEKLLGR